VTDPASFVVVGASLAGLRAVEAARKSGYDGRLVLVGAEQHLPYDRPPLSKPGSTADLGAAASHS
jgi:NADPH-dependent 2,4-dienoyl-CoA reductase/sulfur reductase-like enzyme